MDEDHRIKVMIWAELREAFGLLADTASNEANGYAYESGADVKVAALYAIREAALSVRGLIEPEPEPESCKHTDTRNFGPRAGLRCVACNELMPSLEDLPDSTELVQSTLEATGTLPAGIYKVSGSVTYPAAPEPVNPFAPKLTAEQYATMLKVTISAAVKDGHDVWIAGHSKTGYQSLRVGSGADAPVAFEERFR